MKEKKQLEKDKEEEDKRKKDQMKERIKDFVLVNIKKEIENGTYFVDVPGEKKPAKKDKHKTEGGGHGKSAKTLKENTEENDGSGRDDQNESESSGDQSEDSIEEGVDGQPIVKRKLRKYPFIVDIDLWIKKQRLPSDSKVFIVTGGYNDIKRSLRKRGWVENPDTRSPCFTFRWSLQNKDIDYESLKDFQIVNHFQKSGCITTKVGLCRNLRNLVWHDIVDIDSFYPKCFDLNDPDDLENFVEEFKTCKVNWGCEEE